MAFPMQSKVIPFGEWTPDLPELENRGALIAKNVIPDAQSYRPLRALDDYSAALAAQCKGACFVKQDNGTAHVFAGTTTKLYKLSGTAWTDVSRTVGGNYAVPTEGRWVFQKWGNYVVASNGIDAAQIFDLNSGSNFAALSGSPPLHRASMVVGNFYVALDIPSSEAQARWSGISDITEWSDIDAQSDYEDFEDGGRVYAGIGGDFGVIFQENRIATMNYIGGSGIFQFTTRANNLGCTVPGSIANRGNRTFFYGTDGFYLFDGLQAVPIGVKKVDNWFAADLQQSYAYRVTATIDPARQLYIVSYPGAGASGGTPNKVLFYEWNTGRWSYGEMDIEVLAVAVTSGYTLEGLNAFGTVDSLPFGMDSPVWQGGNRSLAAFDTAHKLSFFSGNALEATIDTGEMRLAGPRAAHTYGFRPLVDTSNVAVALGAKSALQGAAMAWSGNVNINARGLAQIQRRAHFHRVRTIIAAGATWSHAQGIEAMWTDGGAF